MRNKRGSEFQIKSNGLVDIDWDLLRTSPYKALGVLDTDFILFYCLL